MNSNNLSDLFLNGFAIFGTAVQTNELYQNIMLILTIISISVSLLKNLITWFLEAKKDGKITAEEIKQAVDIANASVEEIKQTTGKKKGGAK